MGKGADGDSQCGRNANVSLQLLETMGLIRKLPMRIDLRTNRAISVWIGKEHEPPIGFYAFKNGGHAHYLNISMEVLHQLSSGKRQLNELYSNGNHHNGWSGAMYTSSNVFLACRKLVAAGLIGIKGFADTGRNLTKLLELTPLGRQLWEGALRTGILPDELIGLLLGEENREIHPEETAVGQLIRTVEQPSIPRMAPSPDSRPAAGAST